MGTTYCKWMPSWVERPFPFFQLHVKSEVKKPSPTGRIDPNQRWRNYKSSNKKPFGVKVLKPKVLTGRRNPNQWRQEQKSSREDRPKSRGEETSPHWEDRPKSVQVKKMKCPKKQNHPNISKSKCKHKCVMQEEMEKRRKGSKSRSI